MKVSSDRIEGSRVVLEVELDTEEMEEHVDRAYQRLARRTNVPGFRKGRAPRAILERFVGRKTLLDNAVDQLLPEVYQRALEQEGVEPVGDPELEIKRVDPVAFSATVPVRPNVELGFYRQVRLEPEAVSVNAEETDQALERLRWANAPWEPVERPVALGDLVTLDVQGAIDGQTVLDEKGQAHQVAAEALIPGFADNLVGMAGGQEKEFTLVMPEGQGRYAGQECRFNVAVTEVKEKRLAELDDEFAKSLEYPSLEALRERVSGDLRAVREREARRRLEEKVVDAVTGLANVEYPQFLVEREIDRMAAERGGRRGETNAGGSGDDVRAELRPLAEQAVTRSLVLGRVAEMEGLQVSEEEIDAEVERILQGSGEAQPHLRRALSTPQSRHSLESGLLTRKTLDRLVGLATGATPAATAEPEAVAEEAAKGE